MIFSGDFAHGTNFVGGVTPGNDGLFSGTTSAGGSGSFGVVYNVTTAGKFTELHGFGKDLVNDGFGPYAGVVAASDGKFYGATANGENRWLRAKWESIQRH